MGGGSTLFHKPPLCRQLAKECQKPQPLLSAVWGDVNWWRTRITRNIGNATAGKILGELMWSNYRKNRYLEIWDYLKNVWRINLVIFSPAGGGIVNRLRAVNLLSHCDVQMPPPPCADNLQKNPNHHYFWHGRGVLRALIVANLEKALQFISGEPPWRP